MKKDLLRNTRGMGLIEVMVAIGLLAVVAAGISGLGSLQLKQQTQSNVTFQADSFRKLLIGNINNSNAWKNTIAANPSLSCLAQGGSCTQGVGGPITIIKDANNSTYYTGGGTNGLSQSGAPCSSFNGTAGSGSDLCPFQFQISWTAQCTTGAGTCAYNNAQPMISITAAYNPATQSKVVAFNASQYGANFFQGGAGSNLSCQWQNNTVAGNPPTLTENCAYGVGIGTLSPYSGSNQFTNGSTYNYSLDVEPITDSGSLKTYSGIYVNGPLTLSAGNSLTTQYVNYYSDGRLKTDLQPLSKMSEPFELLHPLLYRWNDKAAKMGFNDRDQHLGFLAQDVEKIFPEAVRTDRSGVKSVDYAILVVPAIQAIKDLQVENKALRQRLDALEKAIESR